MSQLDENSQAERIDTDSDVDDVEIVQLNPGYEEEADNEGSETMDPVLLAELSMASNGHHSSFSSPKNFLHDTHLLLNQQLRAGKGTGELKAIWEKHAAELDEAKAMEIHDLRAAFQARMNEVEEKHDAELAAKDEEIRNLQGALQQKLDDTSKEVRDLQTCFDRHMSEVEEKHAGELDAKDEEIHDLRCAFKEVKDDAVDKQAALLAANEVEIRDLRGLFEATMDGAAEKHVAEMATKSAEIRVLIGRLTTLECQLRDNQPKCAVFTTLNGESSAQPSKAAAPKRAEFDLFEHIISRGKTQRHFATTVADYKPTSVAHLIRFLALEAVSLADAIPHIRLEFQPQAGRALPERSPFCKQMPNAGEADHANNRVETHRFKNRNSGDEFSVRLSLNAADRVKAMEISIGSASVHKGMTRE